MLRIIVFGTGSSAERLMNELNTDSVEILCFADNNPAKYQESFYERRVIPPSEIPSMDYDYIIIASQYSIEISNQLTKMGIPPDKIVPYDYKLHNRLLFHQYSSVIGQIKQTKKNNRRRIALINYNNSNYHGYALMKYMPKYIEEKYEVEMLVEQDSKKLESFDVIVSSHQDGIYEEGYINIELWHGFPIKQMGFMHKRTATPRNLSTWEKRSKNTQLIMSYSQFYSTLINACFPNDPNKYRITGMPRNDLLFESGSLAKLEKIADQNLSGRNVVFFMPTWRLAKTKTVDGNKNWDKLFDFPNTTKDDLIAFLENNNLHLVVKLHPVECNEFKDQDLLEHRRITFLSDDRLKSANVHLYELLPAAKVLITDYSSVFFDTLLLDIPVIFAPTDISHYSELRGFLLEPIDMLTPGPKVFSLAELERELQLILNRKDAYKEAREQVRSLVYKFRDNQASIRVWNEIDQYISSL